MNFLNNNHFLHKFWSTIEYSLVIILHSHRASAIFFIFVVIGKIIFVEIIMQKKKNIN